jgi:hypothetical protein
MIFSARQNLVDTLRRHPGDMNMMKRQTFFLGRLHALGDPAFEFLDRLAADGKLDEMKRHEKTLTTSNGFWKGSIVRRCRSGLCGSRRSRRDLDWRGGRARWFRCCLLFRCRRRGRRRRCRTR